MKQKKILFIDRDGTLIEEPNDKQVDSLQKLQLVPNVIPALLSLQAAGYELVMVSNQDGLGTELFPEDDFQAPQKLLLDILLSQGITFSDIRICPHMPSDNCACRKPKTALLQDYLVEQIIDRDNAYVIGDRDSDIKFANNLGIKGIKISAKNPWDKIAQTILSPLNEIMISRNTNETKIDILLMLNDKACSTVNTGIGFFDHMLEQLIKHSGLSANINVAGDLEVDDHHTVEDTAITLGLALKKILGDKRGIQRYGFLLPMDESLAQVALDLSGRSCCVFNGKFNRENVGGLSTELIPHFFQSLADSLGAAIHIDIRGENTHHMIEAIFKSMGRALKQAMTRDGCNLPTTKGVL